MGEIADSILDGDFCEQCGEYIGPGGGFPGLCSGCRPKRSGGNAKRQRKQARRREKDKTAAERINAFAEQRGLDVSFLQPWHIRVSTKELMVDLFPQRQKFHNVTKNERGQYVDDVEFLKTVFDGNANV